MNKKTDKKQLKKYVRGLYFLRGLSEKDKIEQFEKVKKRILR